MPDIKIVIPAYNDWDALRELLSTIDHIVAGANMAASVLVVDDASTNLVGHSLDDADERSYHRGITEIRILRLRRNLGHQRAIAVGLCLLSHEHDDAAVVIMDGDGEDRPSDIPRLVTALSTNTHAQAAFAQRVRRSEGALFSCFYHAYRWLHYVLTGISVQIGNFSVLRVSALRSIVVSSDLWNHYAAAVVKSRIPITLVPTSRGKRLAGTSSMNFPGLVAHGLSAMSVFADRIGVRLLGVAATLAILFSTGLLATIGIRLARPPVLPAWTAAAAALFVVLILQTLLLAFVFAFMVHHGRSMSTFIPVRDYEYFIDDLRQVHSVTHASTVPQRE